MDDVDVERGGGRSAGRRFRRGAKAWEKSGNNTTAARSGLTSKKTKTKSNITILHQNVCSITNKTGLLDFTLKNHEPDIVVCSETWCRNNDIQRVELSKNELANYCRPRIEHGGVALYTKPGIMFKQRTDLQDLGVEYRCEFSVIELYLQNMIIVGIYTTGWF